MNKNIIMSKNDLIERKKNELIAILKKERSELDPFFAEVVSAKFNPLSGGLMQLNLVIRIDKKTFNSISLLSINEIFDIQVLEKRLEIAIKDENYKLAKKVAKRITYLQTN